MSLINVEKTIDLDIYDHDTTPSAIKAIQMDAGTRTVFAVIRNSGQTYDIGQNASLSLTVLRPDKTKVQITGEPYRIADTTADGETITYYGVSAELTQLALAVKGNLKAQFKITSGEQELRTEIFTINNGEALDAGDGDWAGDLDGHNLDEMAESIETLQTDMAAVNEDVSDLKEELNAINAEPEWEWTYGKKIDDSGNVFNSRASVMSGEIEVESGTFIKRYGATTDSNGFTLMVDISTYIDGVWQARYNLHAQGDELTIGENINSIVVTFSRTNSAGVEMTETDINTYFDVSVYRREALDIDLNKLSEKCNAGLTSSADNDLVCLSVNAYNPDALGVQVGYGYSRETSTIVPVTGYILSDYIPIKQTDYLRFMVDGYDCLTERPHDSSRYSRKIAVYDEDKNWLFTRNLANNLYDTSVVNLGVDGFVRVQIGEYDEASVFISSITKQKYVDVIIFMGQSNMAGRGITDTNHTETAPIIINNAGYEFKSITDPTKLYPMEEPFGYAENVSGSIDDGTKKTGGSTVSFTNAYYEHCGRVPVVGISASEGGTTISQWQPNTNRLNDAINRLETAVTWLNSNGYRIRHKYMAWCQGESDGDAGTTKATYQSEFSSMFEAMKAVGIEKCFLFRIGEYNGTSATDYSEIISAQTEICQEDADVIMVTANQASFKSRGMMKDDFHYYQDAYNEMGMFGGINAAYYVAEGKEPTMYDPKYDNLYYSHIN